MVGLPLLQFSAEIGFSGFSKMVKNGTKNIVNVKQCTFLLILAQQMHDFQQFNAI